MYPLTIIVVGYNRPHALKSLFESMSKLYVKPSMKIPLIISIDNNGTDEVNQIANEYNWQFGPKEVIFHQEKKGLVNHFIWVGDQSLKYEYVLFLEDDFIVSPDTINYALQVIDFYKDDDRIAGTSLYNPLYSLMGMRFYQIQDGYDNYFFQHPYWGNIWFKNKWTKFKEYLKTYKENKTILPTSIAQWTHSFKKIYIQYLIESEKTIVIPRISLVSNTCISGEHYIQESIEWYVPMISSVENKYKFSTFDQSIARYNAFEDIEVDILKKMNPLLQNFDFEIDTKCLKSHYTKPYVIIYNYQLKEPIFSFSPILKPMELSIILDIKGKGLILVESSRIKPMSNSLLELRYIDLKKNLINIDRTLIKIFCKIIKNRFLGKIKNILSIYWK